MPIFTGTFLKGKAVMVGCPKFDDVQGYVDKFTDIFRSANIKSVTVAGHGSALLFGSAEDCQAGMELAGKNVPLEEVVISARGEIIRVG